MPTSYTPWGKFRNLYSDASFDTRFGLLFKQCKEIGDGLDISGSRGKAMFEFLHSKNLLDTVESLVGPEITCNPIQHARTKPPTAYEGRTLVRPSMSFLGTKMPV